MVIFLLVDMKIRVRFFSAFADIVGANEAFLHVPQGTRFDDFRRILLERYPQLSKFSQLLILARNGRIAEAKEPLMEGDVITVFPPLGGG